MDKLIKLNNGSSLPSVGLGLYKTTGEGVMEQAVQSAVDAGYRLFDTASYYKNEKELGEALRSTGLSRAEYQVISKIWNEDQGYDKTLRAFDLTLKNLGFDYLDVCLVHWPLPAFEFIREGKMYPALHKETWRAMRELLGQGKIKSLGVSNFRQEDLADILDSGVKPVLNQIEVHPYLTQKELVSFCHQNDIQVQAWRPIAEGKAMEDLALIAIAKIHKKEVAQIILRWHLQNNIMVIPKSVTPERIKANIDLFDFELSAEEIAELDSLNQDLRYGPNPSEFWREFVVKLSTSS